MPAIPYAPAAAFLGREKRRMAARGPEPVRVALVADGVGSMHGVTHTLDEIRERGVPGFEVDVIGTDPHVDRRLPAVAEVELPFYPGLRVGVPGVPSVVDALAEGRYRLLHVCAPGPAGVAAALCGRMLGLPLAGSYHTELTAYAQLRSGDPRVALGTQLALGAFYGQCGARAVAVRGRRRHARAVSASSPTVSPAGTAASTSAASPPPGATPTASRPTASPCSTPAA